MLDIDTCPSCGSKRVKKVRRTIRRAFKGQSYTVPNLEFHECADCGEKMYDREAMRKIESRSPAFAKAHSSR